MQLKVRMRITGTLQGLIFKMKLIHITGVHQTANIIAFVSHLQCVVSQCSELNVVTFILAKFSWVLKAHFPSKWNTFHYSFADIVFLFLLISRYSHFLKIGITGVLLQQNVCWYRDHEGMVFNFYQTNKTFMLLYWSDNYWRQQFNKYNGMTLLKIRSLRQFEVLQLV